MISSTLITLYKIFKSRKASNQNSIKIRDIKFAIVSISLNILFLIFNLPTTAYEIFINKLFKNNQTQLFNLIGSFIHLMFLCNYGNLFYVSLIVNSLFRNVFLNILKKIEQKISCVN